VGGVAGGMSCATRLRRLDERAKITVIEKEPYISSATCGIPYALGGVITNEASLHVQTPGRIHDWFNVDVRVGTKLVRIDASKRAIHIQGPAGTEEESLGYDKLVLALGADQLIPPIEGASSEQVFSLATIMDLQRVQAYIAAHDCRNAVVIGAAFVGLEAAENLRGLGLNVTLIERMPHVVPLIDADMAEAIQKELRDNGVRVLTGANVTKIGRPADPEGIKIRGHVFIEGLKVPVPADVVVVAAGIRARTQIAKGAGLAVGRTGVTVNEYMQTSDPDIYAVGDMVETSNRVSGELVRLALAGPASRQGRLAADHIAGRKVAYRGNVGTSITKVFGQTVAMVGLSAEAADAVEGLQHEFVTIHPVNHAGYYPGSQKMILKVRFEMPSGRLLGAQIVGPDGVDKRIDVFAAAIINGNTVEDLEHLELAYAPPYGAAKDAVNMAGFVAGNVVRGDVKIVHAEDFASGRLDLKDYQIVDVRSAEEFAGGKVHGAVNISLGTLRDRLDEIDKSKKVLVHCAVGYRGYLAYRIMVQEGFDVVNLDGGYRAIVEGGFASHLVESEPEH
jgi:NADPH-dependent 2,4-dienoyl-CoA reductase/sulfur reductase-like enzyme/rhodanese-related sulfurtransferase